MPDNPLNLPVPPQIETETPALDSTTISAPASNTGQIRNIIQTSQEREIVKQAPDLIVLIDGFSYLKNPYIYSSDGKHPYELVNFNDHVISFNGNYDTDNFLPSCSITLSVPNSQKYLYQAPGGNNVLKVMDPLTVFTKGYYLSKNGNSLYHRVFKGMIKTVSYADNGKTLDITIQGIGILWFLQMMQIDICPAIMSNNSSGPEALVSHYANMNPYEMIAAVFKDIDLGQGFQVTSKNNQFGQDLSLLRNSSWGEGIIADYICKWQNILFNLGRDVHVFGVPTQWGSDNLVRYPAGTDPVWAADNKKMISETKASDQLSDENLYLSMIREHFPEYNVNSNVGLSNPHMQTRLDRLRYLVGLIGFEGYQDVNGLVIVKPPLYNLDCTKIDDDKSSQYKVPGGASTITDLCAQNNPFIVYLSEIITESEIEDEAGIVCTRMQVRGSFEPGSTFINGLEGAVLSAGDFVDLEKLSRFGLREQPPKVCNWIQADDVHTLFAAACHELQKANKGWRNYSFSIPLRPELKLGLTMFIPHKDMYGYVKNISHSYQVGGTATTTVTLDAIRKRPMFPTQYTDPQTKVVTQYYSKQPDMVHKWTTVGQGSDYSKAQNQADKEVQLLGNPTSLTIAPQSDLEPTDEQSRLLSYRLDVLRNWMGVPRDTLKNNFRIQKDDAFKNAMPADGAYFQLLTGTKSVPAKIPYTNSEGYEVISPFPWGRYSCLRKVLYQTMQAFNVVAWPAPGGKWPLPQVEAYLFSGLGPATNSSAGDAVQDNLANLMKKINEDTVFELVLTDPAIAAANTDKYQSQVADLEATLQNKVQMMIDGLPPLPDNLQKTLNSINYQAPNTAASNVSAKLKNVIAGINDISSPTSKVTGTQVLTDFSNFLKGL